MIDRYELHKAEDEFLLHAADAEKAERMATNGPAQEIYAATTAIRKWQAAIDACAIVGFSPEGVPPTDAVEASLWNKALAASAGIEQARERRDKAWEEAYDVAEIRPSPPLGRDDALRRAEMAEEVAQYELARNQADGSDHHLHPSSTKNMFLNDAAELREYAESAACAHMEAVCMSDFGQKLLLEGFSPKQVQDTIIIHAMRQQEFLFGSDLDRDQALDQILESAAVPETETERYSALALAAGRSFEMSNLEITTDGWVSVPSLDAAAATSVCQAGTGLADRKHDRNPARGTPTKQPPASQEPQGVDEMMAAMKEAQHAKQFGEVERLAEGLADHYRTSGETMAADKLANVARIAKAEARKQGPAGFVDREQERNPRRAEPSSQSWSSQTQPGYRKDSGHSPGDRW